MRRLAIVTAIAALAAAAPAGARQLAAESVLPPGQSGFVSLTGVVEGTGSPHLNDQLGLFNAFRFKPAMFNRGGTEVTSPKAGVRIVRDAYGVPAVTAGSDTDAWLGVGYAVAEDRLAELELIRRATSGTLAEILGTDYLDDDLIARRDYYTDAEVDAQYNALPGYLRRRVEAYRDGINAYIRRVRQNPSLLPGEFAGLLSFPRDWSVRDSARIVIFLARTVPSSNGAELENARALQALGPARFARLLPLRVPGRIATVPRSAGVFPSQPGRTRRDEIASLRNSTRFVNGLRLSAPRSAASRGARTRALLPRGGSYLWGISSRRGRAPAPSYLFNGPQLGFSIPELFVEFELHYPGRDLRGVSAPGLPVLGIGDNGHVAWGITSSLSDVNDLYADELVRSSENYRFRGQLRRMDCRTERFQYRAQPLDIPDLLGTPAQIAGVRRERICRTLHGPVQERLGGIAYARRYTLWNRELETFSGIAALNDARTVRDVDRAMLQVTWSENVIAVDDRGGLGYWHPGLHPLRPRRWDERLPYPGTGEAEWRGLLPRRQTPHVLNPRQRYLFQWNNVPSVGWTVGDGEARERESGPWHRSGLLRALVRRVARAPSHERSRAIDRRSGSTAQQRPLATGKLQAARRVARGRARLVLDELLRWDGSYHRTDARNTVDPGVAAWEELKRQAQRIRLASWGRGVDLLSIEPGRSHAFDITLGEAFALRTLGPRALRDAAGRTYDVLERRFGTAEIARWREPRRMYDVTVQGAAAKPALPFFDRGTWQQAVALGP
jgi:acyl-homoserine lactone acylase PvdQ